MNEIVSPARATDAPAGPRSARKRRQIVEAAGCLFMEQGYGATSMDAIAARADVSKRTVYAHFENKETLFVAVMDLRCAEMSGIDPDSAALGRDGARGTGHLFRDMEDAPLADALRVIGQRFLSIVLAPGPMRLYRVVVAELDRFPELGRRFHAFGPAPIVERLSDWFAARAEAGELVIPEGEDPTSLAWRFLGDCKDPVHFRMTLGVAPPPDEAARAAMVSRAVGRFLRDTRPCGRAAP